MSAMPPVESIREAFSRFLTFGFLAAVLCTTTARANDSSAPLPARYASDVQKVRATASFADDLDLARTLLSDADALPAAAAAVLYEAAYELAQAQPAGYDIAAEAMECLAELDPSRTESSLERIFVLRQKQYLAAEGRQRIEIGREILRLLPGLADCKALRGEAEQADLFLRQAISIALATNSDRRPIEEHLRLLPRLIEAAKTRDRLRAALRENPADAAARSELVLLYLVRFDDPASAREILAPDLDETLRSYVPLLSQRADNLPPEVAEEMAHWLTALAERAPTDHQAPLLLRAREFLNRVLAACPVVDPRRRAAAEQFRALERRLAEQGAILAGRRWSLNPAQLGLVATPGIHQSVRKAQQFLWRLQRPDGAWLPGRPNPMDLDRTGMTALATYALLQSGVSPRDDRLRRTLTLLRSEETDQTQSLALRCLVWACCRREWPRRYDRLLFRDADRLCRATGNGGLEALIDPNHPVRRGDAYYTQWAVLALATAAAEGAAIPREFWNWNRLWWQRAQNDDGGWGRRPGRLSRPFYSAAGAVCLLLALEPLGLPRDKALRNPAVEKALAWVDQNFDNEDPVDRSLFLFTFARLGVARGEAKIGRTNWYARIARELLRTQQQDGGWYPELESPPAATAIHLLSLCFARGGR